MNSDKLSIKFTDGTVKEAHSGFICLANGEEVSVYFREIGKAESLLALNQMIAHIIGLDQGLNTWSDNEKDPQ